MSEKLIYTDPEELAEEYDDLDELWNDLQAEVPDLPDRFQDLSPREVFDLDLDETTPEETRQIVKWQIGFRKAVIVHQRVKDLRDGDGKALSILLAQF